MEGSDGCTTRLIWDSCQPPHPTQSPLRGPRIGGCGVEGGTPAHSRFTLDFAFPFKVLVVRAHCIHSASYTMKVNECVCVCVFVCFS